MTGWVRRSLADVCQTITDGSHYSPPTTDSGLPYITVRDLDGGTINFRTCKFVGVSDYADLKRNGCAPRRGDVLFSKDGTVGKVALVDHDREFVVLSSLAILRPDPSKIDSRFLAYSLQSPNFLAEALGRKTGVAIRRVILKNLKSMSLSVPPLEEQQRIVAMLDEAFAAIGTAIANARRMGDLSTELLSSQIGQIFSAQVGNEFESTTVEALAARYKGSMRTGPFGSQLLHGEFVDEGVAVLGIDNAVSNVFRWGKRRCISEEKFAQLSRFLVHPGDVIITIMGTCGRCAVVPADIPKAINSKHLFCITLDQSRCLPEYLHAYFLHAPDARDYLEARAQGSIMAGLNMGIIKEMPVRLPSLQRQRQVVAAINEAKKASRSFAEINDQRITLLACLKQSLLTCAFSGQLPEREPLAA